MTRIGIAEANHLIDNRDRWPDEIARIATRHEKMKRVFEATVTDATVVMLETVDGRPALLTSTGETHVRVVLKPADIRAIVNLYLDHLEGDAA